ncbi:MAG TPA: hypothetical protein VKR56_10920 [Candidatus Cybelea sp.]|nr:hypothetical protein [Candidatus Cybelea sp.]
MAGLVAVKGVLYGTTSGGDGTYNGCHFGCGTAFAITTTGSERTLHVFSGSPNDGARPRSDLVSLGRNLYRTTYNGGLSTCSETDNFGCGTVFRITP